MVSMKKWVVKKGQTLKRFEILYTFSLLLCIEIKAVKVSSKIGKMLKMPIPEVVLDLYDSQGLTLHETLSYFA